MMLYYRLGELDADYTCRHKTMIYFIVAILTTHITWKLLRTTCPLTSQIDTPTYNILRLSLARLKSSSPTAPDSGGRLLVMQRLNIDKVIRNLVFLLRVHPKNHLVVLQWLFSGYAKHQQQTR